jgi:hypothetical protein
VTEPTAVVTGVRFTPLATVRPLVTPGSGCGPDDSETIPDETAADTTDETAADTTDELAASTVTDETAVPTVHVYVHGVVAGSAPLRVADVAFTDEAVVVRDYAHPSPLAVARGGVGHAAATARQRYHDGGLPAVVTDAECVDELSYAALDRVTLHESRLTRPKLAVEPTDSVPYAYRVHTPVDATALCDALQSLGADHAFGVERVDSVGISPLNVLRRVRADR